MQLSNVICDCAATLGASWARVLGTGLGPVCQHNLSSYCLCSRRELDAVCCCLLPFLAASTAAPAADDAAVVINRIVNRKLRLCFVCRPPAPSIADSTALGWGVVIIINNIVVADAFGEAALLCSAWHCG